MPSEDETADECTEEQQPGEEPTVPSHDPFSFKLLKIVQDQQSSNGLRHNDHLRYRQYCARRLRRLYMVLGHKHGKGRFKPAPLPTDFTDVRYLEIPLVSAERAWSYGVQLKADNAAASTVNLRWRHRSINRFAKAVKWAHVLESVCKVHAEQRTQMEAEAYSAFLEGVWLAEKEHWSEAHVKIVRCRKVCEYLSLASGPEESAFLKAKVQELQPLLRECKYNLGLRYDAEDDDETTQREGDQRRDLSGLSYRGQGLAIQSDKIKGKLLKVLQMVNEFKVGAEDKDSSAVIENYGMLSTEFSDVLKDIHADMINVGADTQVDEWRTLEAFARELSISMNVERNLVLLWNHFSKLASMEEIASADARRICRPEEGMRFCDLLKEDLGSLRGLPETTEGIATTLTAYATVVLNCRSFFLALCYTGMGKALEAAAIMDMLHGRIQDVALEGPLQDPLGRLHPLFERVQQSMPSRVAQWRCRGLVQLAPGAVKAAKATIEGEAQQEAPVQKSGGFKEIANFPPAFRDIPCKPLLFDLAFPCIEPPDLEQLLEEQSNASEGQQKGFLGRVAGVAGGLGNRLGGLWGRK